MPIRPENKGRYPSNWAEISKRIRFERARGRCECEGECGRMAHAGSRCASRHLERSPYTGTRVILTVAHLDHTPENCGDDNLKAMCQGCHLHYDREHHAQSRAKTAREKLLADGQTDLFDQQPTNQGESK